MRWFALAFLAALIMPLTDYLVDKQMFQSEVSYTTKEVEALNNLVGSFTQKQHVHKMTVTEQSKAMVYLYGEAQ